MKRLIIGLVVLVSIGFSSPKTEKYMNEDAIVNLKVQADILALQKIILLKQEEAKSLEIEAKKMANKKDVAENLLKQASLVKKHCFKYQAAIACLQQYVNKHDMP